MSLIFATIPPKRLAQGITTASTSFYINNILGFDGLTNVVASNLGTQHYCVFRNDTGTRIEIMEIDPSTIGTGPITIVRRGLSYYGDRTTETAALKLDWSANETIVQLGTDAPQIFQWLKEYIDAAAIAGAVPASTSAAGIVVEASQAEVDAGTATKTVSAVVYDLIVRPDKVRAKKYHDYAADAGATDAYAITLTPAPAAYATGQIFVFKANTLNTGPATLNVNSLGAKAIKKSLNIDIDTGDIKANQIIEVVYDGTNFQLLSPVAQVTTPVVRTYLTSDSPATWTKPAGLKYITVEVQAGGSGGDDSTSGMGGGYSRKLIAAATLGTTETVTIGAKGAGGANVGTATSGGDSSFGAHATATGGGSSPGTGANGDVNLPGGYGGGYQQTDGATSRGVVSGSGSSYFGFGSPVIGTDGSGNVGGGTPSGYGAGGGGSHGTGSGTDGTPGIVIVTEYYV